MPDSIAVLLATEVAIGKLGTRGITIDEAHHVPANTHVLVRNPREQLLGSRRLLIGRTNGGRILTLVIERTIDRTTWVIVTGWVSSARERTLILS